MFFFHLKRLYSRYFDFIAGRKSFVVCSKHANLLVVVARKSGEFNVPVENENYTYDDDDDDMEVNDEDYVAFVIDPKANGISIDNENKLIGCNDVPFTTINFSNVRVTKDQILSETHDGRNISNTLIESSRLQAAILNMVLAKNMFKYLVDFAVHSECGSDKMR